MRHSRARKGEATANRIRLIGLTAASRPPVGSRFRRDSRVPRVPWCVLAVSLGLGAAVLGAQDLGIRQYKPKSTLVVAQHPVPRAKYPVIDIHSHHYGLTAGKWAAVVR